MKKFKSLILALILSMLFSFPAFAGELTFPFFCWYDSSGYPLASGKLYSYVSGTSTPKLLYSDKSTTTPHTNPEILDTNGCTEIYGLGTYTLTLKDSTDTTTYFSIDDVVAGGQGGSVSYHYPNYGAVDNCATGNNDTIKYAIDTCSTDACTIYLANNSGSATTTYTCSASETIPANISLIVEDGAILKDDVSNATLTINGNFRAGIYQTFDFDQGTGTVTFGDGAIRAALPEWWGAITSDSTADTTEIQAALDSYLDVELQVGTYLATLLSCNSGQHLYGSGMYATTIKLPDSTTIYPAIWLGISNKEDAVNISIHDLGYDGNESNNTSWQGVISTWDDLHANGIMFSNNGPAPTSPGPYSIHSVYIRDTLRNSISIQTSTEHVNINNVHLKNSVLDHLMYIRTKTAANISNVLNEGFCRGSYYATGGAQINNIVFDNLTINPYAASYPGYIDGTFVLFNLRNTDGEQRTNYATAPVYANSTISNLTAYVDTDFVVGIADGFASANQSSGAFLENIKVYQINASAVASDFRLISKGIEAPSYNVTVRNVYLKNFLEDGFYLAYIGDITDLVMENIRIDYLAGETATSQALIYLRPDGSLTNVRISNISSNLGGRIFQSGGATTTLTNAVFNQIYLPNSVSTEGIHPLTHDSAIWSNVRCKDSLFNHDGPDGSMVLNMTWENCYFLEGVDLTTELMPNQVDRDFSGASAWDNVDINAYDETGDLTITANVIDQYCTLPVASAPTTIGQRYILKFDLANRAYGWNITSFDGTQVLGTAFTDAAQNEIIFTAETTGGLRIVATNADSSGDFDNFTLKSLGRLSNNAGLAVFSPDGSTSEFNIKHGLSNTPLVFSVSPSGNGNNYIAYKVNVDADDIKINFASNVPAGSAGELKIAWSASISYPTVF